MGGLSNQRDEPVDFQIERVDEVVRASLEGDGSGLDGAMSALVCVPSLVEPVLDRTLVVAAVQRVAVAPARPLIWTRDPTSGVHR